MIKEKPKKNKNNKSLMQIIKEFLRTIFVSVLFAVVVTTFLSLHARNEMIKNLYITKEERFNIDRNIALRLIAETDLTKSLQSKPYSVCMQVAHLYESAGDYMGAEFAYLLATEKTKKTNYTPYLKLAEVYISQSKFKDADNVIESITDIPNYKLIKFKTRTYISMGDKYYSIGKFLKAANSYEKAKYYYDKFSKKDKIVEQSIINRMVNAYVKTADVIVQNGYNSEAVVFLKKALKYNPDSEKIKYKLAIVYSDLDPILSVDYFSDLMEKKPQLVDYNVYNKTLIKVANISELEGNHTKAKYYRYKSHSLDIFVRNKVVYKDDYNVKLTDLNIKKFLFKYHIKVNFKIFNDSAIDNNKLFVDIVLKQNDKIKEMISQRIATRENPLLSNSIEPKDIEAEFGKNIFTKKELENYFIELYMYKDKNFKTFIGAYKVLNK